MAKIKTKNIFVGDTFLVNYLCWKNNEVQKPRSQFGGTEAVLAREPISPLSATVKLVNFETGQTIPLGPSGETSVAAQIIGNRVRYLIGAEHFSQEGSYRVYTKIFLEDEQKMTEVVQFRVTNIG